MDKGHKTQLKQQTTELFTLLSNLHTISRETLENVISILEEAQHAFPQLAFQLALWSKRKIN